MRMVGLHLSIQESNAYAVTEDDRNCVLIDCPDGRYYDKCISAAGLIPKAVLLTHGHLDHAKGCAAFAEQGVKIYCGAGEDKFIFSEENKSIFGVGVPEFRIEKTLKDGEEIELCGLKIKVIATPGHTVGGVSYLIGNYLFTGDTLFKGSIGRSDFPGGDYGQLVKSVKKLYALEGDFEVESGHGFETTLDYERKHNAFVKA